ncbi:hypothetical protein LOZ80_22065 [Paenibacillus sp. HWE-109]|uniref:hypothetical protein n=1 Tax=Paenibacillus sp. HWE-109 TaxID=1306526 RepID=UPI001EE14BB6|nr:hypothetical protein [Paenibacillus sp. HWE-109]UKS24307.1 hypothetical protein LOZ80_22065 [Paenibacillus sp. HWE-109]
MSEITTYTKFENMVIRRVSKGDNKNSYVEDTFGLVNKIETIRLNTMTVVDISYVFDFELSVYTETGRINRIEPLPSQPETVDQKIIRFEAENAKNKSDKIMIMEAVTEVYEMLLMFQEGV